MPLNYVNNRDHPLSKEVVCDILMGKLQDQSTILRPDENIDQFFSKHEFLLNIRLRLRHRRFNSDLQEFCWAYPRS